MSEVSKTVVVKGEDGASYTVDDYYGSFSLGRRTVSIYPKEFGKLENAFLSFKNSGWASLLTGVGVVGFGIGISLMNYGFSIINLMIVVLSMLPAFFWAVEPFILKKPLKLYDISYSNVQSILVVNKITGRVFIPQLCSKTVPSFGVQKAAAEVVNIAEKIDGDSSYEAIQIASNILVETSLPADSKLKNSVNAQQDAVKTLNEMKDSLVELYKEQQARKKVEEELRGRQLTDATNLFANNLTSRIREEVENEKIIAEHSRKALAAIGV